MSKGYIEPTKPRYIEPTKDEIKRIRSNYSKTLFRLARRFKETEEVIDAIENPEKYAAETEKNPLLALPMTLYEQFYGSADWVRLKMALRRTSGVIAFSRKLEVELPGMYKRVSEACKKKVGGLDSQIANTEGRIGTIDERLTDKKLDDYTLDERMLSEEARVLKLINSDSMKIRELCDCMGDVYGKLSEISACVIQGILRNVEAANLIIGSIRYHQAVREANTELLENTRELCDKAGSFVGAVMENPRFLLPSNSPEKESKIDAVLEDIRKLRKTKTVDAEYEVKEA